VYPKPDRTYPVNVVYSSWPAELVQNGDIPSIVDCEDILIAAATFESFLSLQQTDEASLWLKLYVSRLEDFKLDRQNRPGWTPGRVRIPATGYAGDPLRDPFVRRMP
jgi:hypothetical protein